MPQGLKQGIASWIDQFPYEDVLRQIAKLEAEQKRITDEIESLAESLELYGRLKARHATRNGEGPEPPPLRREYPSKRSAALAFLRERQGEVFKLSEINKALIELGAIEAGRDSYHALQVALSNAVARGEVERPSKGLYRMPSVDGEEAMTLTNSQSKGDDGS
jgi:hypothetical protein